MDPNQIRLDVSSLLEQFKQYESSDKMMSRISVIAPSQCQQLSPFVSFAFDTVNDLRSHLNAHTPLGTMLRFRIGLQSIKTELGRIGQINAPTQLSAAVLEDIQIKLSEAAAGLAMLNTYLSNRYLLESTDFKTKFDVALKQAAGIEELTNQTQTLVKELKDALERMGVGHYCGIFGAEARIHKWVAWTWFAGTVVLTLTIAALAATFIWDPEWLRKQVSETRQPALQLLGAKVILVSSLSFGLVLCTRNHRAHRHQQVINRQRENALRTFRTFYDATDDLAVKAAILHEATKCIFAQTTTGYLGPSEELPQVGVMEILKGMTSAPAR